MADEQDFERNYPATPRRLEQARERGQIARSRELTTAAVALAAAIGAVGSRRHAVRPLHRARARRPDARPRCLVRPRPHRPQAWMPLATQAGWALVPFLGLTLCATLAGPLLMSGWVFSIAGADAGFPAPQSGARTCQPVVEERAGRARQGDRQVRAARRHRDAGADAGIRFAAGPRDARPGRRGRRDRTADRSRLVRTRRRPCR